MDLYFTLVKKLPSGEAGRNLIYYMPGLGGEHGPIAFSNTFQLSIYTVGAYLAMFACNVWPCKTWYPLSFGTIVEALGITMIAAAISWGHLPTIYGMLALTGVGTERAVHALHAAWRWVLSQTNRFDRLHHEFGRLLRQHTCEYDHAQHLQ